VVTLGFVEDALVVVFVGGDGVVGAEIFLGFDAGDFAHLAAGLVGSPGHRSVGGTRVSRYSGVTPEAVEALNCLMREFHRNRGLRLLFGMRSAQRYMPSARFPFPADSYRMAIPRGGAGPDSNEGLNSLTGTAHGRAS